VIRERKTLDLAKELGAEIEDDPFARPRLQYPCADALGLPDDGHARTMTAAKTSVAPGVERLPPGINAASQRGSGSDPTHAVDRDLERQRHQQRDRHGDEIDEDDRDDERPMGADLPRQPGDEAEPAAAQALCSGVGHLVSRRASAPRTASSERPVSRMI
jgi:hypothetical protein